MVAPAQVGINPSILLCELQNGMIFTKADKFLPGLSIVTGGKDRARRRTAEQIFAETNLWIGKRRNAIFYDL